MKTNLMKPVKRLIAILSLTPLLAWADQPTSPKQVSSNPAFQDRMVTVSSEFWERPRNGKAVLEQAALRQCVTALLLTPGSILVIHHNDDEEASLRAEELRAWLIALAVEVNRIDMVADLPGSTELQLELYSARP